MCKNYKAAVCTRKGKERTTKSRGPTEPGGYRGGHLA